MGGASGGGLTEEGEKGIIVFHAEVAELADA